MSRGIGHNGEAGFRPISLSQKLATSKFKELFNQGMSLVEDVAAYLDGPGRIESKALPRLLAAGYAAESMRLTTRLMQIASWLLVQKAINAGDLDRTQGLVEKNRVEVTSQGIACQAAIFAQLPETLQEFTARSLQIQARILQHDADCIEHSRPTERSSGLSIHGQFDLLRRAYDHGLSAQRP